MRNRATSAHVEPLWLEASRLPQVAAMTTRLFAALAIALASAVPSAIAQPITYVVHDLGQIDGTGSTASGINDAGIVSGNVMTATHDTRVALAPADGSFQSVPGLESVSASAARINIRGDFTGWMQVSSSPYTVHAIRYTPATGAQDLGSFGGNSYGIGINRDGQIAGWSFAGSVFFTRAFVSTPGQALQDIVGSASQNSFAAGINDAGQVAGHFLTGMRYHAFRYTPGLGAVDLGTPAGADTFAEGINAAGHIVGRMSSSAGTHAFRYTDEAGFQDLHSGAASASAASGINDGGDVVGYMLSPAAPMRAFVYTDARGMIDLNTLIDPASGWVLNAAWAINNAGEIVGEGTYRDQRLPRAYRLTPVVADTTPPVIAAATVDPAVLWPANRQMSAVTVAVDVSDDRDPEPRCRITGVTSSEPADADAIQVTGDLSLNLRAERTGTGVGRTYHVGITCSDKSGNEANTTVDVRVPHDEAESPR